MFVEKIENKEDLKEHVEKYFDLIKENANNGDNAGDNDDAAGMLMLYSDSIMDFLLNADENNIDSNQSIEIWRKLSDAFSMSYNQDFTEEKLNNIKEETLNNIEELPDSYDENYFENMENDTEENIPEINNDNTENLENKIQGTEDKNGILDGFEFTPHEIKDKNNILNTEK